MVDRTRDECKDAAIVDVRLSAKVQSQEQRIAANEGQLRDLRDGANEQVRDIWLSIRAGQEKIEDLVQTRSEDNARQLEKLKEFMTSHAADDTKAMHLIQHQMLARLPVWAMTLMMLGSSMIGAMGMWILNNHK